MQEESRYTVEELAANADSLFCVKYECARAALSASSNKKITINEAKEMIAHFKKMEVK